MRILYGVCGEGLGHAMRSAVVAEHLVAQGHDVRFVTAGRAFKYLGDRWPGKVTYALGLGTVMHENTIQPGATLLANLAKMTLSPIAHVATAIGVGRIPDAVISDFDPWTARYAGLVGAPLIAVDNIHFLNRCSHPRSVVAGIASDRTAAAIMYPGVNSMVPDARRYIVTTFVQSPVTHANTTLHAPIIRPKILAAVGRPQGDHVTVYFNDKSDHSRVMRSLLGVPAKFHVYGAENVRQDEAIGDNIILRPVSEDGFINDLATSKAVIGGAGFTLMTECITLGKPLLASPFGGQFEQILNANYLERMGYGERAMTLDGPTVERFLGRVDDYSAKLRTYKHDGNVELLRAVDNALGGM
jgi:uncharacterized protein (TIGR00661 family)